MCAGFTCTNLLKSLFPRYFPKIANDPTANLKVEHREANFTPRPVISQPWNSDQDRSPGNEMPSYGADLESAQEAVSYPITTMSLLHQWAYLAW